ncbi:MAG: hypothetical protein J6K12_00085 [Clostridia bacterium]|nr:hypothetical protein [Clostridia bacterium]
MNKFFKILLFAMVALLCMSVVSFAADEVVDSASEQQTDDTFTVFCLGNSLLLHGPSENIGWYGNWGMAASAEDRDYFCVMQKLLKNDFPDMKSEWYRESVYLFERAISSSLDADYTDVLEGAFGAKMREVMPDVVTFQFGDNTPASEITAESYAYAMGQCIDFCRSINPDVKIILAKNFYGGTAKIKGAELAAANKAVALVDLSVYNLNEYKAGSLYENSGVAGHPSDLGMQKIAETFYEVIKIYAAGGEIEYDFSLIIDGNAAKLKAEPMYEEETVYISLKDVCTNLGYLVSFDASYKATCVSFGKERIIIPENCQYIMFTNKLVKLSSAVKTLDDGEIFVPIDFFNALGMKVEYYKSMNRVIVMS